jgi:hypothetical protein
MSAAHGWQATTYACFENSNSSNLQTILRYASALVPPTTQRGGIADFFRGIVDKVSFAAGPIIRTAASIFKAVIGAGEPILRGDPITAAGIGVVPEGNLSVRLAQVDFDAPPNFYNIYYPFYPKGMSAHAGPLARLIYRHPRRPCYTSAIHRLCALRSLR